MNSNEVLRHIIDEMDVAPEDNFDGLSRREMRTIIYSPFADECPIRIRAKLNATLLDESPIFRIAMNLMDTIKDAGGVKQTSAGNLPPRIVKDIYAKEYIVDQEIEAGITKLNQETKWIIFHSTKIVLKLAKLVRVYKGRLLLTNKARKLLQNNDRSGLFHLLFNTFATQFNWAYNDGHEDEEIGQVGFLYILYLLHKYGEEPREFSFYSALYFRAFPVFNKQESHSFPGSNHFIVTHRFFMHFAKWFGFAEISRPPYGQDDPPKVRRTELLFHMMS